MIRWVRKFTGIGKEIDTKLFIQRNKKIDRLSKMFKIDLTDLKIAL